MTDYNPRLTRGQGEWRPTADTNWSRLFLAPGMGHCGGGERALDGFELLAAVVEWVGNGTALHA